MLTLWSLCCNGVFLSISSVVIIELIIYLHLKADYSYWQLSQALKVHIQHYHCFGNKLCDPKHFKSCMRYSSTCTFVNYWKSMAHGVLIHATCML